MTACTKGSVLAFFSRTSSRVSWDASSSISLCTGVVLVTVTIVSLVVFSLTMCILASGGASTSCTDAVFLDPWSLACSCDGFCGVGTAVTGGTGRSRYADCWGGVNIPELAARPPLSRNGGDGGNGTGGPDVPGSCPGGRSLISHSCPSSIFSPHSMALRRSSFCSVS